MYSLSPLANNERGTEVTNAVPCAQVDMKPPGLLMYRKCALSQSDWGKLKYIFITGARSQRGGGGWGGGVEVNSRV